MLNIEDKIQSLKDLILFVEEKQGYYDKQEVEFLTSLLNDLVEKFEQIK